MSPRAAADALLPELEVVLVSRVKRNPYVDLLCGGLAQPHLRLRPRVVDTFSLGWMWRHRHIDVLHLHWIELFFLYPESWRSLKRWLSVMLGLLLARLWGVCLIYTVHNLEQHEGRRRHLVRWGTWLLLRLCHGVHVHDVGAAEQLAREWGRTSGVHIIPHGNYVGAYPNAVSRAEARRALDLPADGASPRSLVYLSLGRVRPYKGLEGLIQVFQALEDPDAILLIAGEAQEQAYRHELLALAQDDPRIRLHLAFVADDDLQRYFGACDVCVLPYEHVTTSGAAILAFSFGTPIIAPAMGCFRELVGAAERGMLYGAGTGERSMASDAIVCQDLGAALERMRDANLEDMRRACRRYAADLDWRRVAEQHAAVYRQGVGMYKA
jgi:beta-1,4-mannosyltransferase